MKITLTTSEDEKISLVETRSHIEINEVHTFSGCVNFIVLEAELN